MHTSQFWCKINKFISFSHHFLWKTYVKHLNNYVHIPLCILSSGYFVLKFTSYPHSYQQ